MSNWLSHDLWTEILVRLPAKSLLRFQCVSKSWKSLISSSRFISVHTEHSESTDNYAHLLHWGHYEDRVTHYQLHHVDGSFSEFQELEYPCQMSVRDYEVHDCKGLILFTTFIIEYEDYGLESLILWNPAIRMSMTLPQPCVDVLDGKYVVHRFGFDHTSNDYKVLRILFDRDLRFPPHAELYKLHTGAWETVRGADNFHVREGNTQALVNGASHMLGYRKSDMATASPAFSEFVVVLFHMCDEEFRVMKLPDDHLNSLNVGYADLGVSGGLLSLMEYNVREENVDLSCSIWLMKEYGVVESWTKQFIIDLKGWRFRAMFSFRNNEKIVGEMQKEPVLYDPKTHTFINLGIKAKGYIFAKSTFVESLVLLNEVNAIYETYLRNRPASRLKNKKRKTRTRKAK